MDCLFKGILGITPFIDDLLIVAPTLSEFTAHLYTVLQQFLIARFKVKREKCLGGVLCIDFLGFTMDADRSHPAQDKVCNTLAPKNKAELHAFLGLLNFYLAFYLHKAAIAEPLHRLLDKQAPLVWG